MQHEREIAEALRLARETLLTIALPPSKAMSPEQLAMIVREQSVAAKDTLVVVEKALRLIETGR